MRGRRGIQVGLRYPLVHLLSYSEHPYIPVHDQVPEASNPIHVVSTVALSVIEIETDHVLPWPEYKLLVEL